MAQILSRVADTYLRLVVGAVGAVGVGCIVVAAGMVRSDYLTGVAVSIVQPVPFSHKHHAGELGIDCRYCHDEVERAATAGYPSTHTCMTCHAQLWTNANGLAPVRQSLVDGRPLHWNRVYNLPDYVYFNHSIHIDRGVGCSECHGAVDTMPRVYQAEALYMSWCLDCHRNPAPHLRPPEQVFNIHWRPPPDQAAVGRERMAALGIEPGKLDNCYICHR